jgi:NAD(P)-dependent dehydrogenase (short-subunit alcohol dehydrogenase family)
VRDHPSKAAHQPPGSASRMRSRCTGAHLPVKRIGRPEEIADAVLFLMKNGYVNVITLTVDGGGLLV